MELRGPVLGMAVLAAVGIAGCARKDTTAARLEGSEPQRLSFGAPKAFEQVFLAKIKQCWLDAPSGLIAGYRYDLTPGVVDTIYGATSLDQITLYSGRSDEAFILDFISLMTTP